MVVRRAAPVSLLLALGASLVLVTLGKLPAAAVLTVTAVIGILSTSWLEAALVRILQPGKPRFSPRAVALLVLHAAVWGGFLVVLFRYRQRIELWAVAAGIGCFLLGLSIGGMSNRGDSPREE